jgi:hypothetical protein
LRLPMQSHRRKLESAVPQLELGLASKEKAVSACAPLVNLPIAPVLLHLILVVWLA